MSEIEIIPIENDIKEAANNDKPEITQEITPEQIKPKSKAKSRAKKSDISELPKEEITEVSDESPQEEIPKEVKPKPKARTKKKMETLENEEEVKPKPKARNKKVIIQEDEIQEQQDDNIKTQSKKKLAEKGVCHHCNREMTLKSLKYTHPNKCTALKKKLKKQEEEEIKANKPMVPKIEKSEINKEENEVKPIDNTEEDNKKVLQPAEVVVMKKKNIFDVRNEKINNIFKNAM